MRGAVDYAAMSDPDLNRWFRRRWTGPPERKCPAPLAGGNRANFPNTTSASLTPAEALRQADAVFPVGWTQP